MYTPVKAGNVKGKIEVSLDFQLYTNQQFYTLHFTLKSEEVNIFNYICITRFPLLYFSNHFLKTHNDRKKVGIHIAIITSQSVRILHFVIIL